MPKQNIIERQVPQNIEAEEASRQIGINDTARFWSKVNKTETCWLWTAHLSNRGYGQFWLSGHTVGAHRVAWTILYGPIPNGLWVLHKCDVTSCVRPDHLYLGSIMDNMRDAMNRGRIARGNQHGTHTHPESIARGSRQGTYTHPETVHKGEQNGFAKLTTDQVVAILKECKPGAYGEYTRLAKQYGVSPSCILLIVRRKSWGHIQLT